MRRFAPVLTTIVVFLVALSGAGAQEHPGSSTGIELEELEALLTTQKLADDVDAYAQTAQRLTDGYISAGRFAEAIALYERAAAHCYANEAYKCYALFKRNIAEIDFMMGRGVEAHRRLDSLSGMPELPDYEMTAILFRLGDIECDMGNYAEGINMLERSLELASETGYDKLIGSIYTELGLCTKVSGSKILAIDYLIAAIPHLSAPKHSRVLGHNYQIISDLFDDIGQPGKSEEYLAKAREIAEQNGYDRLLHRVMYDEGMRDIRAGKMSGFDKLEEVLRYNEENQLMVKYATVALDIAAEYITLGDLENARQYLDRGWSVIRETRDPIQLTKYYEHLARYRLLAGDVEGARQAFSKNAEMVDSVGGNTLRLRSLALQVALLEAEGRYRDALEVNRVYFAEREAVNSSDQNQMLFDIEAKHQKAENEKEIELLSAQNQVKELEIQRASRRNLILLLGLGGIGIIAIVSIYSIRLKQRTNRQLAEKNATISKNLSEKELLLKEIHHRVKNNLEVISGLLYLQSKYVDDENVLEAIREGQNRVRSMSLIHKDLYQDDNLTGIKIDEYLNKLIDSLMRSYKLGENKVRIKKDITALNLDVDTVIPLALIINELISNALKYAFPGEMSGELEVQLKEEQDKLVLSVSDNGVGMPEDFDPKESNSLGYKLVDMFTQKLDGTLDIVKQNGTRVVLTVLKYRVV